MIDLVLNTPTPRARKALELMCDLQDCLEQLQVEPDNSELHWTLSYLSGDMEWMGSDKRLIQNYVSAYGTQDERQHAEALLHSMCSKSFTIY